MGLGECVGSVPYLHAPSVAMWATVFARSKACPRENSKDKVAPWDRLEERRHHRCTCVCVCVCRLPTIGHEHGAEHAIALRRRVLLLAGWRGLGRLTWVQLMPDVFLPGNANPRQPLSTTRQRLVL